MANLDIGIDLGTANILVHVRGRGVVLNEPSVIAYDKESERIVEIGEEARAMLGRTPGNLTAIRPLKHGVISEATKTEKMLKYFIRKAVGRSFFGRRPRIAICVPSGATEVERRAVEDAAYNAGARYVFLVEEPVAAALGAGLDIIRPVGNLVVDIGGGTTDIAVISMGGAVVTASSKIAGDDFDDAIVRYIRKRYNILIGDTTADDIKINIGTCYKRPENISMDIRGRDLVTGLPKTITITSDETEEALRDTVAKVIEEVRSVLEKTPPELAADIADRGIILTGGGSLLHGFEQLMEEKTGITTMTAENPQQVVAIGAGKYIDFLEEKDR